MKEVYSVLRRRPDGKSLGHLHDYMWQAAALLLASQPLSQAEFEAIMSRLERSCRTFRMGPTSTNYVHSLDPPSAIYAHPTDPEDRSLDRTRLILD